MNRSPVHVELPLLLQMLALVYAIWPEGNFYSVHNDHDALTLSWHEPENLVWDKYDCSYWALHMLKYKRDLGELELGVNVCVHKSGQYVYKFFRSPIGGDWAIALGEQHRAWLKEEAIAQTEFKGW